MSRAFVGIPFLAFIQGLIHIAANAPQLVHLARDAYESYFEVAVLVYS